MSRRTHDVRTLIEHANLCLKNSKPEEREYRRGVVSLLEFVLHATDNYTGFGYLEPWEEGKTDETRRSYYVHARLARKDGGSLPPDDGVKTIS